MKQEELEQYIACYANDARIPAAMCKAIPKADLEVGKMYHGHCRNSAVAVWHGDHFTYMRTKWGFTYEEKINHYEDDDGYDVFVPCTHS